MKSPVDRKTVDLTAYRDLVVIYLGMRIRILRGLLTMLGINKVVEPFIQGACEVSERKVRSHAHRRIGQATVRRDQGQAPLC